MKFIKGHAYAVLNIGPLTTGGSMTLAIDLLECARYKVPERAKAFLAKFSSIEAEQLDFIWIGKVPYKIFGAELNRVNYCDGYPDPDIIGHIDALPAYTSNRKEMKRRLKPEDDHLSRPFMIDCCKDGTLTVREIGKGNKRLNDAALPVFSANTFDEAKDLIFSVAKAQYEAHPDIPNETWYRIIIDNKPHLDDTDDLEKVTAKLAEAYEQLGKYS